MEAYYLTGVDFKTFKMKYIIEKNIKSFFIIFDKLYKILPIEITYNIFTYIKNIDFKEFISLVNKEFNFDKYKEKYEYTNEFSHNYSVYLQSNNKLGKSIIETIDNKLIEKYNNILNIIKSSFTLNSQIENLIWEDVTKVIPDSNLLDKFEKILYERNYKEVKYLCYKD